MRSFVYFSDSGVVVYIAIAVGICICFAGMVTASIRCWKHNRRGHVLGPTVTTTTRTGQCLHCPPISSEADLDILLYMSIIYFEHFGRFWSVFQIFEYFCCHAWLVADL